MDTSNDNMLMQVRQEHADQISSLQQIMKELEESNRRLVASEALKSRFLSNIRNEINNPLTVVIGAAANMLRSEDPVLMRGQASLIYRESQLLSFQLENIFMAAELEAGELQPGLHPIAVDSLLQVVLDTFCTESDEKQLDIQLSTELSDEPFYCDEQMLRMVFCNMIHNAIKFSPEQKPVIINARVENQVLHLSVTDRGKGIPVESFDQVFDRFRQLDEGPCKTYQGHGLGLSITKALVEVLGGSINIQSVLEQGTSLVVEIPSGMDPGDAGMEHNEFFGEEDGLETF
ncbi:MAG: HAMP domain-containing histidine kinase [Pontiellaceae bacterium]|nr:HAMP domain-containing histidine kinase [Pontiellaceae bacterium]